MVKGQDERRRGPISWFLAVALLPVCLVSLHVVRDHAAFVSLHDKVCDYGADGLQILRAAQWQECLGPYSRFRFHHPGPISFYYFAGMERVLPVGWGQGAHLLYQLLLNAFFLGWILHVVFRNAGRPSAALCFGAICLLTMARVSAMAFVDPWAPIATILPFLLFAVSAAGLAGGRLADLLPMGVGATFAVQNQVGFVPSVVLISLPALAAFAFQAHRGRATLPPRVWVVPLVTALFVVVAFLPPVLEEVAHGGDGNLSQLYRFFTGPGERHSVSETAGYFARWFAKPFYGWGQPVPPPTWAAALCVAGGLAAAVSGLLSRNTFLKCLSGAVLACLLVPVFAATRVRGLLEDYLFLYYFGILAAAYSVGAITLGDFVARGRASWPLSSALAIVCLAALSRMPALEGAAQEPVYIERLCRAIDPRAGVTYQLVWDAQDSRAQQWGVATGLAYRMLKEGRAVCVPDEWSFMFGRPLTPGDKRNREPVYLFNSDAPDDAIKALPADVVVDRVCGPTRMIVGRWPARRWPVELRYDAPDGYFVNFDRAEDARRWSIGKRSVIEFAVKDVPRLKRDAVLHVTCSALTRQDVVLLFNGHEAGVLDVTDQISSRTAKIPGKWIIEDAVNALEFIVPNAHAPGTGDRRELGICFVGLKLDRR